MSRPWLDKTHFCGFETSVHPHGEEYEWDYAPGESIIHDTTSEWNLFILKNVVFSAVTVLSSAV